jgi:FkbM family methyltransferase
MTPIMGQCDDNDETRSKMSTMSVSKRTLMVSDLIPPALWRLVERTRMNPGITIPRENCEAVGSYSQYFEDVIVDGLLGRKPTGTYVDIGACDPDFLSNTKRFYDRGWSGINVEPHPQMFEKLRRSRSRDINLNVGVGATRAELSFYVLSEPSISSFNRRIARLNVRTFGGRIVSVSKVSIYTIADILEQHAIDRKIDFMSLDVEGFELEALKGNDWSRFRPLVIIVETNKDGNDVARFLENCRYAPVFTNMTNTLFIDEESLLADYPTSAGRRARRR